MLKYTGNTVYVEVHSDAVIFDVTISVAGWSDQSGIFNHDGVLKMVAMIYRSGYGHIWHSVTDVHASLTTVCIKRRLGQGRSEEVAMLRFTVTITRGDAWGTVQQVTLCAQDFLSAADEAHWQCGSGYADTIRVECLGSLSAGTSVRVTQYQDCVRSGGRFEYDGKFEYGGR
jgi:hypothetical protein